MLEVLVVDDEQRVQRGLAEMMPWSDWGYCVSGTASHGADALLQLIDEPSDVAIVDIGMPVMSGLDLIAACAARNLMVKFVILTAHDEFDYARRAMSFGVKHYLLKPTDEEELEGVLRSLRWEIETSRTEGSAPPQAAMHPAVLRVIRHLRDNIANADLSLRTVAEEVAFLNYDYLGEIFHRETGHTFTEYLTHARIREAMRIWQGSPRLQVYEIAEQSGFGDQTHYFSKVFKKVAGLCPSVYKSELLKTPE